MTNTYNLCPTSYKVLKPYKFLQAEVYNDFYVTHNYSHLFTHDRYQNVLYSAKKMVDQPSSLICTNNFKFNLLSD